MAMDEYHAGTLNEPLWGALNVDHVQLVPQSRTVLTLDKAKEMRSTYPNTQFRLHANARVLFKRCIYDIANYPETKEWFELAAQVQHVLGASVYSAHAGYRKDSDLPTMFDHARALTDLFEMPVAIEGLYPDRTDSQLLSTWKEYQALLESGLPFALDLSHLHIVATRYRHKELTLTQEMLASENCLEIHVSDNDGRGDWHQTCSDQVMPWWFELLKTRNPEAIIFTEGNRRRHQSPHT